MNRSFTRVEIAAPDRPLKSPRPLKRGLFMLAFGQLTPPDFGGSALGPNQPASLPWSDHSLLHMQQPGWHTGIGKRIVDIFGSLLVIAFVLSWLIPVLSLLIRLDSPGPIFFVQPRSGRKGRMFYCFKLRTMYNRLQANFEQTRQRDARVTLLGSFLRRTNLDELPQFINVLLGDMSLVGPRPHPLPLDAQYWELMGYQQRYAVKPGITGLAQVRGNRGATGQGVRMDHRIRYDHFYIRRQSLGMDLKICVATLRLMVQGDQNAW